VSDSSLVRPTTLIQRSNGADAEEWRFTGLYGFSEKENKLKTCDLLLDLRLHTALPWLVGGDFNEILFNYQKKGGRTKAQATLEAFHATLDMRNLFDLGFSGHDFN